MSYFSVLPVTQKMLFGGALLVWFFQTLIKRVVSEK